MIPERIALAGFLSYEEEQVLTFDQAPLWLLAGPNGSGKSSVFDGITFALFGGHRGGERDYHELINKKCDGGAVEFDFRLDDQRYRIRRTLKRTAKGGRCTQHVAQWRDGGWQAVSDTTKAVDFDRWVQENIGLNYKTFTASVLLVQGKADRLLLSEPRERHEMLASIIDLDRYARLHDRAAAERRQLENQAEVLRIQLEGTPEVTPEQVQSANDAIAAAEVVVQTAQTELDRLREVESAARHWAELCHGMQQVSSEAERLKALLAQAESIRREGERWRELTPLVPALQRVLRAREALEQAAQSQKQLAAEQEAQATEAQAGEQALAQVVQKLQQRELEIAALEQRRRQTAESLQALTVALHPLRTLYEERERLREQRAQVEKLTAAERQAAAALAQWEAQLQPLREDHQRASEQRVEADHAVTRQTTLLQETKDRAQRFYGAVGEKLCRYCGQALTAEHVRTEQVKLEGEVVGATAAHQEAKVSQATRLKAERKLSEQLEAMQRSRGEVEQRLTAARRQRERTEDAVAACTQELARVYQGLTEPFRAQVAPEPPADWLATSYPNRDTLEELESRREGWKREEGLLEKSLQQLRQQNTQEQKEEKRLRKAHETVQGRLIALQQQVAVQEALHATAQQTLTASVHDVPPAWQARSRHVTRSEMDAWQAELDALRQRDLEARLREVDRGQQDLDRLQAKLRELQQRAEAIPAEARCPVEAVTRQLAAARQREAACQGDLLQARNHLQQLHERRRTRERLAEERGAVLKRHSHFSLLAKYLDRDWLQRHLMRQAEQAIVAYARDILDRLSDGQLSLRLRHQEEGDKALVLEAFNRTAAEQSPHRVEMLSGSERFRVAVSLALAIGQYASRQHRPIQSVIIDEGFGCLDPTNRQLMIQELHNLQGQLQRILLVSHQDEFADAFTNGYRFELVNGATQVKRFAG